jgi:hypothetical protein
VPRRRRFPWPRRRRETAIWAGAVVFVPILFSLWLAAVLCTTPVLLACSVAPSWSLRRAARRCLRGAVDLSVRCIGVCTVSVVSLGIMVALGARFAARRLMTRKPAALRAAP